MFRAFRLMRNTVACWGCFLVLPLLGYCLVVWGWVRLGWVMLEVAGVVGKLSSVSAAELSSVSAAELSSVSVAELSSVSAAELSSVSAAELSSLALQN